ncbi:MAG: glycosyltransferase family 2 protein [Candidatus Micrarchaeota archaeon]|nr:glycosyltransferase family 2 protein [Candidatus Micrarchaeota archaeon]
MADLSIIIPTKNEAECIGKTLRAITEQLKRDALSYEILVVDDTSTDGTQDVVQKFYSHDKSVHLVRHGAPHAFGYSVRDGVKMARGKMLVIMMADLSDDPKYLKTMWKKFNEGYDVVAGSRFLRGSHIDSYSAPKLISNRLFNLAVQVSLLFPRISDSSNNFKAFSAAKAKGVALESAGFEVGAELFLRMLIAGAKVAEIPVSWTDRTGGAAKFRLSGAVLKYFGLFVSMFKLKYFGGVKA